MHMRWLRWLGLAGVILVTASCGNASAQTESAAEKLERLTKVNSLVGADAKPWHLKMDVTVFDDAGANPEPGTIEMWKPGADTRTAYSFGGGTATLMEVKGVTYHSQPWTAAPYRAEQLLQEVLHPGPGANDLEHSVPELRKIGGGKTPLECIMLTQPVKRVALAPLGLYPTYCMEPGKDAIVASYNYGGETVSVHAIGKFMDHIVPTKLEIQEGTKVVATTAVTTLNSYVPTTDEFVPGPEMKSGNGGARVAGGVIAGNIVTKVSPVYPESAKQDHVQGTVVLRAIIGREGHVHGLRPISSPDPDLTIAAIAAVRRWTYKPYTLNGEPTEVDTTITVNFALNQ